MAVLKTGSGFQTESVSALGMGPVSESPPPPTPARSREVAGAPVASPLSRSRRPPRSWRMEKRPPGLGPSLDRMLSSSSSVSSLNSSTVKD